MTDTSGLMTFGGHLEALRRMCIRICVALAIVSAVIFCFKDLTFQILLAPSRYDFVTYGIIERVVRLFSPEFHFEPFRVDMIATELSSQFMTHISTSLYLGLLCTSPFILMELFRFVTPALLEEEKRYSLHIAVIVYALFLLGVLMSYFVLFPVSFRFLGTYSVAAAVHSAITIDSYVSVFVTLTLLMGLVFQLPVVAFVLARKGLVGAEWLIRNRKYALIAICVIAAIITPPDVMSLVLVACPIYLLYEVSIRVIRRVERSRTADMALSDN